MPENNTVSQNVIVLLWHSVSKCLCSELYQCMHHPQFSLHYTAVGAPIIRTVIAGLNSIFLEWSPPSEGSPLSYTVTWTGRGVTSNVVLLPTARDYTIEGLDSNTAYLGTVVVYSLAKNATESWNVHTLPHGELVFKSNVHIQEQTILIHSSCTI